LEEDMAADAEEERGGQFGAQLDNRSSALMAVTVPDVGARPVSRHDTRFGIRIRRLADLATRRQDGKPAPGNPMVGRKNGGGQRFL
jgi:hypothetical protein